MKIADQIPKIIIAVLLLGGGAVVVSKVTGTSSGGGIVEVTVPELSQIAALGKEPFDTNCVQCHGPNGSGTDKGPPLVHKIYNPGHHDDGSFMRATKNGVQGHHWKYGNMPPQPQVNAVQIASIIKYIRELQMGNGIFYEQHRM